MEPKLNPSVSYMKVWSFLWFSRFFWRLSRPVKPEVTSVFQMTRKTSWTSLCPWRATGQWMAAGTRSGGTLPSQAALGPPVGFYQWWSSMTKSVLPAWASWLDTGEFITHPYHVCSHPTIYITWILFIIILARLLMMFWVWRLNQCYDFFSPRPCRIMGLYVSVVLVIGKFVRGFFSEISHSIMFEELPCVDRILKLCTDIFLVSVALLSSFYCSTAVPSPPEHHLFHSLFFLCSRCVRLESWSWRRSSTPNSFSSTAHQRPWSNGPGTSKIRTGMRTKAAGRVWPLQSLKQVQWRLEQTHGRCLISTTTEQSICSCPETMRAGRWTLYQTSAAAAGKSLFKLSDTKDSWEQQCTEKPTLHLPARQSSCSRPGRLDGRCAADQRWRCRTRETLYYFPVRLKAHVKPWWNHHEILCITRVCAMPFLFVLVPLIDWNHWFCVCCCWFFFVCFLATVVCIIFT